MRRKTTAVRIGNVVLSSEEPVLVQSMLNTSTREVDACVEQAIRIIEAGGRLVRITAPGVKEAEMLGKYTVVCVNGGYTTPISADIHFVAEAASVAARYVEKVRINPGNFADKRATFKKLTYTDEEYAAELEPAAEIYGVSGGLPAIWNGCPHRYESWFVVRSYYEPLWRYPGGNGGGYDGVFAGVSGL